MYRSAYRALLLSSIISMGTPICAADLNQLSEQAGYPAGHEVEIEIDEKKVKVPAEHKDVCEKFLKLRLTYKPNKDNELGKIVFKIVDLANPLSGTFDISQCGNAWEYLSISTGFRAGYTPANANKVEVWIGPYIFLAEGFPDIIKDIKDIEDKNGNKHNEILLLYNWGGWHHLKSFDVSGSYTDEFTSQWGNNIPLQWSNRAGIVGNIEKRDLNKWWFNVDSDVIRAQSVHNSGIMMRYLDGDLPFSQHTHHRHTYEDSVSNGPSYEEPEFFSYLLKVLDADRWSFSIPDTPDTYNSSKDGKR